jgi:hypothetical protein
MISTERLLTLIATLGLCWQESCGDPTLFCYRVASGLAAPWKKRRPNPSDPVSCSIPSDTFSTPSSTSKA